MNKTVFSFKEFDRLVKEARCQFLLKTKNNLYFLPLPNYSSYNENGFVAHNEITGQIDVLAFNDVIEVIVDSKKYSY